MTRGTRSAAWALAVSLLLHLALLGGAAGWLPHGQDATPEDAVFQARLVTQTAPPPPPPPAPPPPRAPAQPAAAATPASPAPSAETANPPAEPDARPPAPSADLAATSEPDGPGEAVAPDPAPDPAPAPVAAEPALPPLNALPARLDLRFDLHYGLASGEQTLVWVSGDGRYTLTSVAAATGLTGVFYRGRFVQTSRGRLSPAGLVPEEFWDQRGDKRASARLDAGAGRVTLTTARGEVRHFPYPAGMQDVLSLFFQLALTAPPPDGELRFAVFNGKKLREYAFASQGEARLETALGTLRTLHLVRSAGDGERFEAWLAIDHHYLPVKVVRSDEQGRQMELRLRSLAP